MQPNKGDFCQHFKICSGCSFDAFYPFPPIWDDVLEYFKSKNIDSVDFHAGSRTHWRNRAKLAVRGSSNHPLIGLFKEGTHEVIPIPFCQIHREEINRSVDAIKQFIKKHDLTPYNEKTSKGDLRYLQLVVERTTGKVQASFVLNFKDFHSGKAKRWKFLLTDMAKHDKENIWHSIWINLNDKQTNTIFGSQWDLCYGQDLLWEKFKHISVCFQPSSFAQANLDLFEKMLVRLDQFIEPESNIAEFYAGVGVIGLFITHKSSWVRSAEINLHAEFCFSRSKSILDPEDAKKNSFHTGSAQDMLAILDGANVVVVDPPRKGLDADLLRALNESDSVKQLVYVSCGWEAFKKDCDYLLKSGWLVVNVEGYLFFPGSNHIEILANFKKKID